MYPYKMMVFRLISVPAYLHSDRFPSYPSTNSLPATPSPFPSGGGPQSQQGHHRHPSVVKVPVSASEADNSALWYV